MFVVFDLDGTLSNAEHRVHHIKGDKKDWRAFYDACDGDEPLHEILYIFDALKAHGAHIEIWTGRSDDVMEKTFSWLKKHGIQDITLKMRRLGDYRLDTVLKREWLEESSRRPDLVFEDRSSVVQMWRDHGILCLQVAPGEF